ncbi:MAG: NUDIX domain-containing protein [Rhodomicrobiaceae bacterium]
MKRQLFQRVLFPYWRLTRGMTVGVQAVITKSAGSVLLIRHGYRPGWHFPGGGVEWRETLLAALAREVEEETGVIIKGQPRLHGVFANFKAAPSDHVAVYLVQDWEQPKLPPATFEIREQRFFPLADLPGDIVRGARRRLAEIFEAEPIGQHW